MSKVNQLIPTIRAQHQIHDLREIKWLSPKQRCSNVPMILPSWQTGPSLPQETAMIDFALVWRCGRRQTESLQRQKYHQSWKLNFANGLGWIWFRVVWPVLSTVQCCVCQAGHETLCAFPQSRYPYLSSPHRLPSKYFPWFPKKFAEICRSLCWDHQPQMSRGNQSMCLKRSDLTMK